MADYQRYFVSAEKAVKILKEGQFILYPTETYYAIGCDAFNSKAVALIYAAKKRESRKALPLIISSKEELPRLTKDISPMAERLMEKFWPGPLTILFKADERLPDLISGQSGLLAVRMSSHPAPGLLCRLGQLVLTASSANVSGRNPVMLAKDLDPEIVAKAAGILPMEPKSAGLRSSTIIKINEAEQNLIIMRQGAVSQNELEEAGFIVRF